MTEAVFWIFAAVAVVTASLCILSRSALSAVLWLTVTMLSLAAIYVLLGAEFVAAIQVLVYAGAVMVLFLFVIMLLDLKVEERRKIKVLGIGGAVVAVGIILGIFVKCLHGTALSAERAPNFQAGTMDLGKLLFTQYLLPFEIVSVLLLVAMVGVILLSKKDLK